MPRFRHDRLRLVTVFVIVSISLLISTFAQQQSFCNNFNGNCSACTQHEGCGFCDLDSICVNITISIFQSNCSVLAVEANINCTISTARTGTTVLPTSTQALSGASSSLDIIRTPCDEVNLCQGINQTVVCSASKVKFIPCQYSDSSNDTNNNIQLLFFVSTDVSIIGPNAFTGLSNSLQRLSFSNDKLTMIDSLAFFGLGKLTTLEILGQPLEYINGYAFQYTPNLFSLVLDSSNNLTLLNANTFRFVPSLTLLKIYKDHIVEFPPLLFQYNHQLTYLDISSNYVTTLPVELFMFTSKLLHLDLSNMPVQEIPLDLFSNVTSMQYLSLGGWTLWTISFPYLQKLTSLTSLTLNQLDDDNSYSNFPLLQQLFVSDSLLTPQLLAMNTNLTTVVLEHSQTLALFLGPFASFANNTFICGERTSQLCIDANNRCNSMCDTNLQTFQYCTVSSQYFSFSSVTTRNKLVTCACVPNNYQGTCIVNYCSNTVSTVCHISENQALCGQGLVNVPCNWPPHLTLISLSVNKLTSLLNGAFTGTSEVVSLFLNNNALTFIDSLALVPLISLKTLDLGSNPKLTYLVSNIFASLQNLHILYLAGLGITSFQPSLFTPLHALNYLSLDSNAVIDLPNDLFGGQSLSLTTLSLGNIGYSQIDPLLLANFTTLLSLDFNSNHITMLSVTTFSTLTTLRSLFLQDNDITFLPAGIFDPLAKLQQLSLGGNSLATLPDNWLQFNQNLVIIDISLNSITQLSSNSFPSLLTKLQVLNLTGNPLTTLPQDTISELPIDISLFLNLPKLTSITSATFSASFNGTIECQGPHRCDAFNCINQCGVNSICSFPAGTWSNTTIFTCSCFENYTGSPCQPINNCITNNGGCTNNTSCQYISAGSSVCVSISSASTSVGVIGGVIGGVCIIVILIVIVVVFRRRRRFHGIGHIDDSLQSDLSVMNSVLKSLEIARENVTLSDEIGQGEFGIVMSGSAVNLPGSSTRTVMTVAVKMLKDQSTSARSAFIHEASRIQPLQHDNVCKLLAVCFRTDPCMMLLEFMTNGDLKSFLRRMVDDGRISTPHLLSISCDVCRGFVYLQRVNYVHRDIAARNVLLNQDFVAKISDFGMARRVYTNEYYSQGESSSKSQWVLPIRWMAPESFFDGTWSLQSDVWMFGVLIWEIFHWAQLPWGDIGDAEVMRAIQDRKKLGRGKDCPEDVYEMMLGCWKLDINTRVSATDLLSFFEKPSRTLKLSSSTTTLEWPRLENTRKNATDVKSSMDSLEVSSSAVTIIKKLGSGEFGEVMLASMNINGTKTMVAVKYVREDSTVDAMTKFKLEAQLLAGLRHAHIVEIKAVCFTKTPYFIALELMSGGDLLSYIHEHTDELRMSSSVESDFINTILQIADAMSFLERRKIVHRDLAARNVLVGSRGLNVVKLSDLGMSRELTTSYYRKTANYKIPAKWMAPEALFDKVSTHATDVWSFGVLSWEVFSFGEDPYNDMEIEQAVRAVVTGYRLPRPVLCPEEIYELMLRCWNATASLRPTFGVLVETLTDYLDEGTSL